jgi:hypothetical protein
MTPRSDTSGAPTARIETPCVVLFDHAVFRFAAAGSGDLVHAAYVLASAEAVRQKPASAAIVMLGQLDVDSIDRGAIGVSSPFAGVPISRKIPATSRRMLRPPGAILVRVVRF